MSAMKAANVRRAVTLMQSTQWILRRLVIVWAVIALGCAAGCTKPQRHLRDSRYRLSPISNPDERPDRSDVPNSTLPNSTLPRRYENSTLPRRYDPNSTLPGRFERDDLPNSTLPRRFERGTLGDESNSTLPRRG